MIYLKILTIKLSVQTQFISAKHPAFFAYCGPNGQDLVMLQFGTIIWLIHRRVHRSFGLVKCTLELVRLAKI